MDLYQETVSALEAVMEATRGPPAMPELQPRTINWTDPTTENYGTIPRRWMGLTRTQDTNLPKLTKEASTSMENVSFSRPLCTVPGNIVRPKSMYVAETDRLNSEINMISDNIYFNKNLEAQFSTDTISRTISHGTSNNKGINNRRLKVRRNPVQRAASRLYRLNNELREADSEDCVGPEFVIRASLPSKQIIMPDMKVTAGKTVTIILLNGQKLDVVCNPNCTAGQLFEYIIQKEHIEENFMFGLSALITGDFVFLPSDTRISKLFQEENHQGITVTLFLRVRFFLPTLRGFRGNEAKHLLYLQLRRSIIEHQLPCSFKQIIELNGLALQVEFGNYNSKEHGQRDYFLIEHYIPESMSSAIDDLEELKRELVRAHISKTGLDTDKAKENFIAFAQSLPHYGGHFYTATWMMKDNNHKDIWLYICAQGISLYERGKNTSQFGPIWYEKFEWRNIQTLCYSKQYLCILPHSTSDSAYKLKKYKLKMDQKKSYFTFRLASLHHQFFLRFRTDYISPQTLSQQFGIPLKDLKNETNSMYKLDTLRNNLADGTINAETEFKIEFRTSSRLSRHFEGETSLKKAKSIGNLNDTVNENDQNKENENYGSKYNYGLVLESKHLSGIPVSNSVDKRRGVKMGTRAFVNNKTDLSRSMETVNIISNEDLEEMSLQSVSINYSSTSISRPPTGKCTPNEAYILDSTVKQSSHFILPDFQESISESLLDKLNNLSVVEERVFITVPVERDANGSLGLQITEGSDGHVYVQSVIEGGAAYLMGNIRRGDQIIAVDQKSLVEMKYTQALKILKSSGRKVEFVLARLTQHNFPKGTPTVKREESKLSRNNNFMIYKNICDSPVEKHIIENCRDDSNINKYGNSNCPSQVSYHKHIRYEIEPERDSLMLNKELPHNLNLNKSMSKSCTHLTSSEKDRAVVVEMIPKEFSDLSKVNSLDRNLLRLDIQKEPIALPRSLGVSRRWRGPVRYPVTPIKKLSQTNDSSLSLSDDEQVFI